jgi:hypothetical protein
MKNSENKYDKIIDKYYNELPDEAEEKLSESEQILSNKLNLALDKMDILKAVTPTFDINILEIIEKGEEIKEKKRNSLEFLTFIAFGLLIIASLILVTFYYGERFFIYYELLTFIFVPILILSLAKLSQTGGN